LENFGHPEVVIFGMNPQVRHSILNFIGKNVREGNPFAAGREHDWVLEGHNCWSRDVQKLWYQDLFGWAIWFYGGTEFPAVQCLASQGWHVSMAGVFRLAATAV
jgi:hypothetical protein